MDPTVQYIILDDYEIMQIYDMFGTLSTLFFLIFFAMKKRILWAEHLRL